MLVFEVGGLDLHFLFVEIAFVEEISDEFVVVEAVDLGEENIEAPFFDVFLGVPEKGGELLVDGFHDGLVMGVLLEFEHIRNLRLEDDIRMPSLVDLLAVLLQNVLRPAVLLELGVFFLQF